MNIRIRNLRETLRKLNLDGMIITNPESIKYLTKIESEGTLLITRRENIFVTYAMYMDAVNSSLTINDEIVVMDTREISKEDYENFFVFCENVGFEEKYVTYEMYNVLKQRYRINNFVETEQIIEKQRQIKEEEEIINIKKACEITDRCFEYLLKFIQRGMTEKEVALEIEIFFRKNGADALAFSPIVAFGENSAFPHWVPSDRKLESADVILIDMGCVVNGYCSDMTRTIFLGCILENIKPIYDLVLKNQMYALNELKDGTSLKTISKAIDNSMEFNKFDVKHALGHGVGLEVHEIPTISSKKEEQVKENMVLAIEPGVYIPGKYGIRIEDTVLITKQGIEVLTKSKKEYIVI